MTASNVSAAEAQAPAAPKVSERLMSIDALRGFDMFWIFGGRELFIGVLVLLFFPKGLPAVLDYHLEHPQWLGFSAWDMIMPLFLFLSGVSIPFAFSKRMGEKHDYRAIYRRMARRMALLWLFGMIAQGNLLAFDIHHIYLYSNTLQAIAAGYIISAVAVLHISLIGQIALCAGLLVLYWLLMMFVPIAGMSPGYLEPYFNLAGAVDYTVLGRFHDGKTYAWILPSLGFGASVLLGVFAGHVLRRKDWPPMQRFFRLCLLGLACLLGGWLWSFHFPIIKHLWTSSMVLWAGGWCYLLLAVFYLVIDIWGWRKWTFPFVVIGANAIVAYMVPHIIHVGDYVEKIGGFSDSNLSQFLVSVITFIILWVPLWIMYKRKIFVRV